MRVLVDTNVLVSFLLGPSEHSPIRSIFQAFLEQRFILLVPEALLHELLVTVQEKPRLARRILPEETESFATILRTYGENVAPIHDPIPQVTRDPKDDYLMAYALVGAADFLITGDQDLLSLAEQVPDLEIMTPAQFVKLL